MSYDYPHNRRAPLASMAHYGEGDESPSGEEQPQAEHPLKLLVMDRRGAFGSDIERAARSLERVPKVVVVSHPTHLLEQVQEELPDVVLVAPEEMTTTGLRRLAQVHRGLPKTVIALTQGAAPVSLTAAAACGASEVISYPASVVKLRNALGRICQTAEALRGERVVIREVPAAAAASPAALPDAVPAAGSARVFTVTSPTGGCGKTFFATNLAAYLAGATGGRVLLVDLDLQFGEVSLALGLRPLRTIAELINEESIAEAFPEYLIDHSAGYKVLSAPADPFAAELVGPREATQVLEVARRLFDYVVVDTPPSLNEVVLAAFDQSRYLVVMATLDVPSLRNLKVFLETIDRLKLPAEDVSCVLNKAEPDNGIDLQELLRVYPGGFAAVLPYSKEVSRSLNVGQPVLMVDPRAEISQKLLEAGTKLVPAAEVVNPGWGTRQPARTPWSARRKGHAQHPVPAPVAPRAAPSYQPPPPPPARPAPAAPAPPAPRPQPAEHQHPQPLAAPLPGFAEAPGAPQLLPPPPWGPTAPQAPQPAPHGNWLSRLFGRGGRHSISRVPPAAPGSYPGPYGPPPGGYPPPPAGYAPAPAGYAPAPGTNWAQPAADASFALRGLGAVPPPGPQPPPGGPLAGTAHENSEEQTPVFSGSREAPPQRGRRRRPAESPKAGKEPRR